MTILTIVTLVSMLVAAIMSLVAWRVSREERRRSEARVAALAAEIHGVSAMPAMAQPASGRRAEVVVRAEPPRLKAVAPAVSAEVDLFAAQPAPASSRSVVVFAVGLFVFATAAALVVVLTGGSHSGASPANLASSAAVASPANPANLVPLELVALGHERDGDRLVVRGVVRNPAGGARVDRITAVVFVFNHDGGFLASGRAAIESPALGPGGESTFVVAVPGAAKVDRYRVSFRTDAGIVPHVDRRNRS